MDAYQNRPLWICGQFCNSPPESSIQNFGRLFFGIVGRASLHLPLSSSTTAFFEKHQQANLCYLLAGIVNGIIGNSKISTMY